MTFKIDPKFGLKCDPSFIEIAPGQREKVALVVKKDSPGLFKGEVKIVSEFGILTKDTIDVQATVVDYNMFLTNTDGMQVLDINLGVMYFGDKINREFFLVNNSPLPTDYSILFRLDVQPEEIKKKKSKKRSRSQKDLGSEKPPEEFIQEPWY